MKGGWTYRFAVETMEEHKIRVLTTADLGRVRRRRGGSWGLAELALRSRLAG
jgi:hypothetical protein